MKASPEAYVAELVGVLCEVRRVLAEDGVLWVNTGDSNAGGGFVPNSASRLGGKHSTGVGTCQITTCTIQPSS